MKNMKVPIGKSSRLNVHGVIGSRAFLMARSRWCDEFVSRAFVRARMKAEWNGDGNIDAAFNSRFQLRAIVELRGERSFLLVAGSIGYVDSYLFLCKIIDCNMNTRGVNAVENPVE